VTVADAIDHSLSVQAQASALGFDWPDAKGVLEKIEEETREIQAALEAEDAEQARRELGDLLLASVNLSRFLGVHPAEALRQATNRFSTRFEALKIEVERQGKKLETCSLEELDEVWNHVKIHALQ
jgi:uncharacterized protein YabN with tetrapyrrole methylase and pyrophosphatase domain